MMKEKHLLWTHINKVNELTNNLPADTPDVEGILGDILFCDWEVEIYLLPSKLQRIVTKKNHSVKKIVIELQTFS